MMKKVRRQVSKEIVLGESGFAQTGGVLADLAPKLGSQLADALAFLGRKSVALGFSLMGASAVLLGGGAEAWAGINTIFAHRDSAGSSSEERVYSVAWWIRTNEASLPSYRPVETAEPELDTATGRIFSATNDGKIRGFDKSGLLWELDAKSRFDAGPTVSEDRLFVAGSKGTLYCLEAKSGKVIWTYSAPEELLTKPVVAGGVVLVFSTAETLYAIDKNDGKWRWQYKRDIFSEYGIRGGGRPLVIKDRVFAGFGDGHAVALNLKDGSVEWLKNLGGGKALSDVDASPVTDGAGHVFFASFATGLFSLDASNGNIVWQVGRTGISELFVNPESHKLFAGGGGFVSAYSIDSGANLWQMKLGAERFVSGLGMVNGVVLASTGPGPLLFLDAVDGRLRRTFDPGRGIWARPLSFPHEAYVLSNRGCIYELAIDARGRL